MATARESTLYANLHTNKYLGDGRDYGGRTIKQRIAVTVVSAAAVNDTYKVAKLPANCRMVDAKVIGNGNGASAGAGVTVALGDAGSATRYITATDFDAANASASLNNNAGMNYTPTADTDIVLTFGGAAPVVGTVVVGYIEYIPGA